MKRLAIIAGIVLGAMLLGSCYFMSAKSTGSIQINFGGATLKATTGGTTPSPTPDKARIYLYTYASSANYSLYTFPGGLNYYETGYPGTATLNDIPVGQWQVLVSIGNEGANGSFATSSYGQSAVFTLVSGDNHGETVPTTPSPFVSSVDLLGKNINGVVTSAGTPSLCASDSGNLYTGIAGTNLGTSGALTPVTVPGYQIQSLGAYNAGRLSFVLVNTNQGIGSYSGTTFNGSFSQGLTTTIGTSPTVLQSGGEQFGTTSAESVIFYQRTGGLGGGYFSGISPAQPPSGTSPPSPYGWDDIDLSGKVVGQPVYQFSANTDGLTYAYGFFATKLGAFWTTQSLISSGGDMSTEAHFFNAPLNAIIEAIGVNPTGTLLYVGTPNGAYYAQITESAGSVTLGSWVALDRTLGDSIIAIAASSSYVALRSAYNIYVVNTTTQATTPYPFYGGLPGRLQAMAWDSSTNTLYLGGSAGLVSLVP